MNVIDFPIRYKPVPPPSPRQGLGDTFEAALDVHRIIINCMRKEELRDHPGLIGPVLDFALAHYFGGDLACWAEMQFEAVYGIDPRGFVEHVTASLG